MVDTQKSCRGLTYQEATDCVLGLFLDAWAKISLITLPAGDEKLLLGEKMGDNIVVSSDGIANFYPNPVHFDNVEKEICIIRIDDTRVISPDDGGVIGEFRGLPEFEYRYIQIDKTTTEQKPNSAGGTSPVEIPINDNNGSNVISSVIIRHTDSFQDTLGGRGNRSFVRTGVLVIKLQTGLQMGLTELYKCANIIAECFEGKPTSSSLWFQNVQITEGGVDGLYYQSEVVIAFQYDQVK